MLNVENKVSYKGNSRLLIGIILAVLSFWLFAQSVLNMEPVIQKDLGMNAGSMSLGVSITALFSGLFIVFLGGLADRLGRVRFTLIGLTTNIVGSVLIVVANGALLFIAGRIFQGLSAAFIMPATMALVKTYYEGAERQRAVSYWSLGSWGGSGLCSFFGGMVANTLGWRYVFIISIIVSVISFVLIMNTPESKVDAVKTKFDFLGLILFIVSMLALNTGISSAQQYGLTNGRTMLLFAITVIGLLLFFFLEKNKVSPFMDFKMFSNKFYLGATISNFLLNAVAGTLIVINTYMQIGRGASSQFAGEMSLGYLVCIIIAIPVGEKMLQKFGAKIPMILGALGTLVGITLMLFVNIQGSLYFAFVFIGYAIFGMGLGIYATPSTDTAISTVSNDKVGSASGIYKMASSLGGAIGVALSLAVFSTLSQTNIQSAAVLGLVVNIIFGILSIISINFIIPKIVKK